MENFNRGTRYLEKNNYTKAVQFFRRQNETFAFKECYLNLGNALNKLNKHTEACAAYLLAQDSTVPFLSGSYKPYPEAYNNLGLLAYAHNNNMQACELYKLALHHNPLFYDAIFNLSLAELRAFCSNESDSGEHAWKLYSYRFLKSEPTKIAQHITAWDLHTPGDVCVVLSEQGLGDHIQFARYIPLLQHYFKRVVFQCPQQLHSLFPQFECVVEFTGTAVSIPLMSLAQRFGIIDGCYLRHVHRAHEYTHTRLNIGCEWRGSATHENDHNRSCAAGYFSQLHKYGNLYSIRPQAESVANIVALNSQSWKHSAELVAGLDLVVTVDTSLVHLAGALGVPTLLLQPRCDTDFRWGLPTLGSKNIWYSSVEVIRNPDSWEQVFKQVTTYLEHKLLVHKHTQLKTELQKLLELPC